MIDISQQFSLYLYPRHSLCLSLLIDIYIIYVIIINTLVSSLVLIYPLNRPLKEKK